MSKPVHIADQTDALSAYFREMLTEADIEIDTTELTTAQTAPAANNHGEVQALLCELQGLKLAVPLSELDGILKWPEDDLPKLPGKPSWYLGLYTTDQQHTQVVDIGHIILPERIAKPTLNAKFIVLVDNKRWGIACDKVSRVITLNSDTVKWRNEPGKRPWLAGTVLKQMCSILNITELVKLLKS